MGCLSAAVGSDSTVEVAGLTGVGSSVVARVAVPDGAGVMTGGWTGPQADAESIIMMVININFLCRVMFHSIFCQFVIRVIKICPDLELTSVNILQPPAA
jgi:hypothetical protein